MKKFLFIFFCLFAFASISATPTFAQTAAELKTAELKKSCDNNNGSDCVSYGLALVNGEGIEKNYPKALEYFKLGCDKYSYGVSCNNTGILLGGGNGIEKDENSANSYYRKACNLFEPKGCHNMGSFYEDNTPGSNSNNVAIDYYERACSLNYKSGCERVAILIDFAGQAGKDGTSPLVKIYFERACILGADASCKLAKQYKKRVKLSLILRPTDMPNWQLACLEQSGFYCFKVGLSLANGDYIKTFDISRADKPPETIYDYQGSRAYYRRGCDLGDGNSCLNLGMYFYTGQNSGFDKPNYALTYKTWSEGCDLGNANSCNGIGVMYLSGQYVAEDYAKAAVYFYAACLKNQADACRVANSYDMVEYIKKLKPDSAPVIAQAAACKDTNDAASCLTAGNAFYNGAGAPKNSIIANFYYNWACQQGSATACYNVGKAFNSGEGVTKDLIRAKDFYEKSCNSGINTACTNYTALSKK